MTDTTDTTDWRHSPPYAAERTPADGGSGPEQDRPPLYHAGCFCGAVAFEVYAHPVDAKICHCRQCQVLHGAPCQWAVIFHKHDVRFVRGVDQLYFYSADLRRATHSLPCKLSCRQCRAPIADEGRRMFLAFGPLFDFGLPARIPPAFQPTCHIFYDSRVLDIDDGKPKYPGHRPVSAQL